MREPERDYGSHPIPSGVSFYAATVAAFFVYGGLGGSAEFGFQHQRAGGKVRSPKGMTEFV